MQKDILNLTKFFFENNTGCHNEGDGLAIHCNSLRAVIGQIDGSSEFLKVTIREGIAPYKDVVSQIMPTESLKEIISEAWHQLERKCNHQFIENYGLDEYKSIRESYFSALKGEKEDEQYIFNVVKNSENLKVSLMDKYSEFISSATLGYKDHDSRVEIYGAAIMRANFMMKNKTPEKDGKYKWSQENFVFAIPTVEFNNYNLGLSIKNPYNTDSAFSYLLNNVEKEDSKNLLTAFQLQKDLKENASLNKKLKL